MKPLVELGKKVSNIENTLNNLGKHLVEMWDFVHRSNFANVTLAYLFSQGVTSFRFDMVLQFSPKDHVAFLTTNKGYYRVRIYEENEMVKVDAVNEDYIHYVQDVHDHLVLMSEQVPESMKKQYLELAERWKL